MVGVEWFVWVDYVVLLVGVVWIVCVDIGDVV